MGEEEKNVGQNIGNSYGEDSNRVVDGQQPDKKGPTKYPEQDAAREKARSEGDAARREQAKEERRT